MEILSGRVIDTVITLGADQVDDQEQAGTGTQESLHDTGDRWYNKFNHFDRQYFSSSDPDLGFLFVIRCCTRGLIFMNSVLLVKIESYTHLIK